MRWTPTTRRHVRDLRGRSGVRRASLPIGGGGLLLLLLLSWFTGADLLSLFSAVPDPGQAGGDPSAPISSDPREEQRVDFVNAVMADAQDTWDALLPGQYEYTSAVLFRDAIQSACGFAESATGPFYCPGDRHVYLDLSFFDELDQRLGAPGDFAQAYVLAHEIGHHVQTLTGIEHQVRAGQQHRPSHANQLSVALELQADCFAGLWGHAASQPGRFLEGRVELETGDVEEGLNAAAAIGDDRLQERFSGRVMPDAFTHGSSEQRVHWFRRGLASGRLEACDTFAETP